jgi:hypothetical protein
MINKLIENYGKFSDSIIQKIEIETNPEILNNIITIKIKLYCCNILNDFLYETIELEMSKIIDIKLCITKDTRDFNYDEIFIKENKEIILFDFDPIDYIDYLEENPNSKFKVSFRGLKYKKI